MTREKAINILSRMIKDEEGFLSDNTVEAHKMAIQALSQEPCEDAISREELLKAIDTWDKFGYTETGCFVREPKCDYVPYIHYDDVIKCIKNAPLVTPQQKMGHWIYKQYGSYPEQGDYHCSECDGIDNRIPAYCPNCGTKMVDPQERSEE